LLSRHGLEHFFPRWITPQPVGRFPALHGRGTKML
jgi:hypothetical protein